MTTIVLCIIASLLVGFLAGSFWRKTALKDAQKKTEQIQEETEAILKRYDILTENLAASVTIRDQENHVAYCSPYTEVLTGYSLQEIYEHDGDFFLSVVHEEDKERYLRALKVITSGEPFQFRYRFFHKSGLEMWAETRTVPLIDEGGNLLSSLSITLDVTGTIRYQRQVEEKNQDLQDFTYMVTHDLKSPIYTIKGMCNVIDEDCSDTVPESAREPLQHIKTATSRLESLVSSVLEYSQISSTEIQLEKVSLKEAINQVEQDFKHQLLECSGGIELKGDLPFVSADKLMLYQILSNLIGNALKYRSPDRAPKITLEARMSTEDRYVVLDVADNGAGIMPEKLSSIFRPFQRAVMNERKAPEGNGIGLACVQKLVMKLGGDITVESTHGEGSAFTLTLKAHR